MIMSIYIHKEEKRIGGRGYVMIYKRKTPYAREKIYSQRNGVISD
jgi:hypothetical protein